MMRLSESSPVGLVVAERIGRARVFDQFGIDYCCHGSTLLGDACTQRSLDVQRVLSELSRCDFQDIADVDEIEVDYAAMSATALAEHIEQTHHSLLRRELPRLADLIDKVAEHHGERNPELFELRRTFSRLRQELEVHLRKEEQVLFPLVKQLEAAHQMIPMHCGTVANPIRVMEHEHDDAGTALRQIRDLTGDFQVPADGCSSWRALYQGLAALETDLHRHIHKENNILFPKAAELEAALIRAGA